MASESVRNQFKDYTLTDIVPLDKELGCGAYGKVFAVDYCGLTCAAKEVHPILLNGVSPQEKRSIMDGFIRECVRCKSIIHPNIVQFLGVYFTERSDLPIMVMEMMNTSVACFVKVNQSSITLKTKLSILHDISLGLRCLHSKDPPIVHRDLSSNNVLLTDYLKAKISDMGMAKMICADSNKLTRAPGTLDFMPPEALEQNPVYGTPVDVFSFAGIALHLFSEEWPTPPIGMAKLDLETNIFVAFTEVQRRQNFIDKMTGDAVMLKPLVTSCLHNNPRLRPTIKEVLKELQPLKQAEEKKITSSVLPKSTTSTGESPQQPTQSAVKSTASPVVPKSPASAGASHQQSTQTEEKEITTPVLQKSPASADAFHQQSMQVEEENITSPVLSKPPTSTGVSHQQPLQTKEKSNTSPVLLKSPTSTVLSHQQPMQAEEKKIGSLVLRNSPASAVVSHQQPMQAEEKSITPPVLRKSPTSTVVSHEPPMQAEEKKLTSSVLQNSPASAVVSHEQLMQAEEKKIGSPVLRNSPASAVVSHQQPMQAEEKKITSPVPQNSPASAVVSHQQLTYLDIASDNSREDERPSSPTGSDSSDRSSAYDTPNENTNEDYDMDTNKKYDVPLIPADCSDRLEAIKSFTFQFAKRYGPVHPNFVIKSLEDAVQEATGVTPAQRKLLFLYLHHDESKLCHEFCNQLLCSETVVSYLSDHFVSWGWDLTTEIFSETLLEMLRDNFGHDAVKNIMDVELDNFPIMLIVRKSRRKVEVHNMITGVKKVNKLMDVLSQVVNENQAEHSTTRMSQRVQQHSKAVGKTLIAGNPTEQPVTIKTTNLPSKSDSVMRSPQVSSKRDDQITFVPKHTLDQRSKEVKKRCNTQELAPGIDDGGSWQPVQNVKWEFKGTFTLSTVGNLDKDKNGTFQICDNDGNYSLNLRGHPGVKQSHFRLYHATIHVKYSGQFQVMCLESALYRGVYVSWNTGSHSVEFLRGTTAVPPRNVRCIGWNQSNPESPNEDYPNCVVLRAWTTPPQQGADYYLSFGSQDLPPDSSSANHMAQLTTDQAKSGAVVLTKTTEYQKLVDWLTETFRYVKDLPKLSTKPQKLQEHKKKLEQLKTDHNQHQRKFSYWFISVTYQSTDAVSMKVCDESSDMLVKFQWVVEELEERLKQCSNLIEWRITFDVKYKENLDFISQGEKFIDKHFSGSINAAAELEKCSELKQKKDEEQHKHATMLEEGRKIIELNYVDVDKEHTSKLDQITERWQALWEKCDKWHEVVTARCNSDGTKQSDKSKVGKVKSAANIITAQQIAKFPTVPAEPEPFRQMSATQASATLSRNFGSREPTTELQKKLQEQLTKEDDPNASENLESKIHRRNSLGAKSSTPYGRNLKSVKDGAVKSSSDVTEQPVATTPTTLSKYESVVNTSNSFDKVSAIKESDESGNESSPSRKKIVATGSRVPDDELQQILLRRLSKAKDSNALQDFEAKVKEHTKRRRDNEVKKQDKLW